MLRCYRHCLTSATLNDGMSDSYVRIIRTGFTLEAAGAGNGEWIHRYQSIRTRFTPGRNSAGLVSVGASSV
jgi:hypothetical protein